MQPTFVPKIYTKSYARHDLFMKGTLKRPLEKRSMKRIAYSVLVSSKLNLDALQSFVFVRSLTIQNKLSFTLLGSVILKRF